MFELAGNIHMHTQFSDGTGWHIDLANAAIAAGLDFIIVTDHNIWVDEVEGYYKNENGRVLLLVGEEVHDVRRVPQANHCLVIGAEKEVAPLAPNPQELIDEVNAAGGYTFLAHPNDAAAPAIGEASYAWYEWDIEGFTGLELWNYMSNFKSLLSSKLTTLRAAFYPEKCIIGPLPQTLTKWDELLTAGKRISIVGGSDAHANTYSMGPLKRVIFPYEFLFRAVNTHILIEEALTGEMAHDKPLILAAVGQGNSWVGYDMAHATKGFRFTCQSRTQGIMGGEVKMDAGATLQIRTPAKCHLRLIHNGNVVAEAKNDTTLTHLSIEQGAYRAECQIIYEGRPRGWIYSNTIYLK